MAVVLTPKALGWFATLVNIRLCLRFGGPLLLTINTLFETLLSALYAPILMFAQTHAIWAVLHGSDSGWKPQRRDDGTLGWGAIARTHRAKTVVGIALALVAWLVNDALFLWLLPITLGMVFSAPLSQLSGGAGRGRVFAALGLLRAPEEKNPAPVLVRLQAELEKLPGHTEESGLMRLANDPALLAWHRAQLAGTGTSPKLANFNAPAVTAAWKVEHATSLAELCQWLDAAESLALLSQPTELDRIKALPETRP